MITESSVALSDVALSLVWHQVWCGTGVALSGVALSLVWLRVLLMDWLWCAGCGVHVWSTAGLLSR